MCSFCSLSFAFLIGSFCMDFSCCSNALSSTAQSDVHNNKHSIRRTKITDLNTDCLLTIFESLNISELMTLAETNKYFKTLAVDVFRRKSANKSVLLSPLFEYKTSNYYSIDETDTDLTLRSTDTILKFLALFGQSISRIIFAMGTARTGKREIKKAIGLHCSKTLTQLRVYDALDDDFDEFDKTFEKVEKISLNGDFRNFDAFFRVFPFVRQLNLGCIRVVDLNETAFERNLPNLEYLEIETTEYASDYLTEAMAARLFQNNPQIRALTLRYVTHNLLTHVADHLHLIENLTLFSYLETAVNLEHTVHLDYVKRLDVEFSDITMPKNVTFGNLIEYRFEIFTNPMKCTEWMEFVQSSDSLQVIHIGGRYFEREEFDWFAAIGGNLVEIHVKCQSNFDVDTVGGLLRDSKKLKKLHLSLRVNDDEGLKLISNALKESIADNWILSVNDDDIFIEKQERF